MDSIRTTSERLITTLISNHLSSIRNDKRYRNSLIVFAAEGNLTWVEADRLANLVKANYEPCYLVKRWDKKHKHAKYGISTGNSEKKVYVDLMNQALEDNKLWIADDIISQESHRNKIELVDELSRYHKTETQPSDYRFQVPKPSYSGKLNNKPDDNATVLMMCIYVYRQMKADREFREQLRSDGTLLY